MPIHVDEHANPMNITNHHRECVVTLSAAKGLIGWVARSFAALRMTRPVVLGVVTLSIAKGRLGSEILRCAQDDKTGCDKIGCNKTGCDR